MSQFAAIQRSNGVSVGIGGVSLTLLTLDWEVDRFCRWFYCWVVTLAEVKSELERLSPAERKHLAAYLLLRDRLSDLEARAEWARKIDDKDPGNWVGLDEAEKRFKP